MYFMTDGEWDYPETAIKKLNEQTELLEKLQFTAVVFRLRSYPTIEKMVINIPNASIDKAPTVAELKKSFIKLVPNLYG